MLDYSKINSKDITIAELKEIHDDIQRRLNDPKENHDKLVDLDFQISDLANQLERKQQIEEIKQSGRNEVLEALIQLGRKDVVDELYRTKQIEKR